MAAESLTDEELLRQVQEGNSSAFAALVRRHNIKFYSLAYRYLQSREEAEDMIQSAFLKLWERPDMWQAEKGAQFTTWFYRVIVNMCLDKKKKRYDISMPENFEISDGRANQEKNSLKKEEQVAVKSQISLLPKRQKTALILCVYEELSHKEAAEVMKLSEKALQSLLMRAKTTLKKQMKKYL